MAARTRVLLLGAVTGLLMLVLAGGGALALVERVGYLDGVWLAFTVISTTGFGDGPESAGGRLLTMVVFALGAVHWFGVLVAAFELGLARTRGVHPVNLGIGRQVRPNGTRRHEMR